ncbi:TPA: hypothetical protein EYH33_02980 [Candidatus Bipolaricaulota bacterium]|nr:hypothetical protein [Candidatus Bipolaricaulota bacterium]
MRKGILVAAVAVLVVCALPGLAKNEETYIRVANAAIDRIVAFATERIQEADTYKEMLFWAAWAEFHVKRVLAWLERMIGPVEYEVFYVTVYNEKVGRSVTFDPIHVIGG